jgi:hypothetical protein
MAYIYITYIYITYIYNIYIYTLTSYIYILTSHIYIYKPYMYIYMLYMDLLDIYYMCLWTISTHTDIWSKSRATAAGPFPGSHSYGEEMMIYWSTLISLFSSIFHETIYIYIYEWFIEVLYIYICSSFHGHILEHSSGYPGDSTQPRAPVLAVLISELWFFLPKVTVVRYNSTFFSSSTG